MGRKELRSKPFRYCTENKGAHLGFPRSLSEREKGSNTPETWNARRHQQRRRYGRNKLAVNDPPSAGPSRRPRELKIRVPLRFKHAKVRPAASDHDNNKNEFDPIATPVFSTPKVNSCKLLHMPPLDLLRPDSAQRKCQETPQLRSPLKSGGIGLSIDRRLMTTERNLVAPPSACPSFATTIQKRISGTDELGVVKDSTERKAQVQKDYKCLFPSDQQSGGFLSNHKELTVESASCRSSTRSSLELPGKSEQKRNSGSIIASNYRQPSRTSRDGDGKSSPRRTLLFGNDSPLALARLGVENRSHRSIRVEDSTARPYSNKFLERGIRSGDIDESSSQHFPRKLHVKEYSSHLEGVGHDRKAPVCTGQELCEFPPPCRSEWEGGTADIDTLKGKDSSLRSRHAIRKYTPCNLLHSENESIAEKALGCKSIFRRARSPSLMPFLAESDESSIEEQGLGRENHCGNDEEVVMPAAELPLSSSGDERAACSLVPTSHDPDASLTLQVDLVRIFPNSQQEAHLEKSGSTNDEDDLDTVPPSPEQFVKQKWEGPGYVCETVLCRPLVVNIPAGALRSPPTPENWSTGTL